MSKCLNCRKELKDGEGLELLKHKPFCTRCYDECVFLIDFMKDGWGIDISDLTIESGEYEWWFAKLHDKVGCGCCTCAIETALDDLIENLREVPEDFK